MPLPQISLSKQLILLVAMPAAVQLGIMLGLGALEYQGQVEADKAEHVRQVHDSLNQLMRVLYHLTSVTDIKTQMLLGIGTPVFGQEQGAIYKQFGRLKELLKNDPKQLQIVQLSERSTLQAMAIVQQLKELQEKGEIQDHPERKPLLAHLRHLVQLIVSPELIDLANSQGDILDQGPIIQQAIHNQARCLIVVGGLFSLLLSAVLAIFLTRRVALRLENILDNTERLANHKGLNPPEISTHESAASEAKPDEIARLDQAFHDLAKTLAEITAKQTAIIDNAGDMVCAMDEDGKIISANAAGGKMFGRHQAELIGKNYRDIVHRKDVGLLSNHLQRARTDAPSPPVQLRLVGRGRRTLYVLWSAQWTSSENQYFSVVHDLTHLKEAQRMKQEVVAIVTNDLRRPLTTLHEFLDLLEEGSIARMEERGQRYLASARRNANQMQMLVDDMIDLEKAKNGMLVLNAQQIYLDNIIDKAQVVVGPFAEEKDVILDCRRSELTVKGEEDKLMRVLTNLLGNAVQFAPRASSILVVTKSQDGFAQVSISDKGPGISAEQIGTIFDAFTPMATASASSPSETGPSETGPSESRPLENEPTQGSGLGLAISRAFVELHGGTITATSRLGEGTTIVFTLPLAATSVAQKAQAT